MKTLPDSMHVPSAVTPLPPSRLFYALWPDAQTADKLAQLQNGLAGRHTHPNDMHLTLAFVGIQPDENLPVLHAILRDLVLPEAFRLDLIETNSFQNIKVSWAGPHITPPPLAQVWRMLGDSLDEHKIWWDKKIPFRPHVTLARKVVIPHGFLSEPVTWQARRVVLAASVPGAVAGGGGKYRILAERELL